MATLYITEYQDVAHGAGTWSQAQAPQVSKLQLSTDQTVGINGSTTQSSAFQSTTLLIRVHCDAICSIVISGNPVATVSNARLAANQTEYFGVLPGDKLAVIANV